MLDYISETIEQFATRMFLSALENHGNDMECSDSGIIEKRTEQEVWTFIFSKRFCPFVDYMQSNIAR